jgi:hypothetical protein
VTRVAKTAQGRNRGGKEGGREGVYSRDTVRGNSRKREGGSEGPAPAAPPAARQSWRAGPRIRGAAAPLACSGASLQRRVRYGQDNFEIVKDRRPATPLGNSGEGGRVTSCAARSPPAGAAPPSWCAAPPSARAVPRTPGGVPPRPWRATRRTRPAAARPTVAGAADFRKWTSLNGLPIGAGRGGNGSKGPRMHLRAELVEVVLTQRLAALAHLVALRAQRCASLLHLSAQRITPADRGSVAN